jgi:NTE family protein
MADIGEGRHRAVVLGGGGVAGIAWEIGVLAALIESGIAVNDADLVIGTSAGSVVGATLRYGLIPQAIEQQLTPAEDTDTGRGGFDAAGFMARLQDATKGAKSDEAARAGVGVIAREVTGGLSEAERIEGFAVRFPETSWPERPLAVTAVDATDGTFWTFDGESAVELPRALAASCCVPAVWAPISIEGRVFMDGGMRSGTNADLAEGYDKVLIIACFPEAETSPLGPTLPQAVEILEKRSSVLVITADTDAMTAFGANPLLMSSRAPSAAAGRAQGARVADDVARFWNAVA